jgi:hypothetical protein
LSGFLWDREHEARKVEMRGEGASWRSSFQHGAEFICWRETKIG